jgi:hypothetical protein
VPVDIDDEAEDDLAAIMQDLPRSKTEILNSGLQLAGMMMMTAPELVNISISLSIARS